MFPVCILLLTSIDFVAFPVSGMVTIPVSMYQTVVTNIQNLGEAVTMSALTAAATDASQSSMNDQEMADCNADESDVKVNGNQTITSVVEES